LAGARTHENETRPEEIYDHERVCVREMFSHFSYTLDSTLDNSPFSLSKKCKF
jgi:hypothetical protein